MVHHLKFDKVGMYMHVCDVSGMVERLKELSMHVHDFSHLQH